MRKLIIASVLAAGSLLSACVPEAEQISGGWHDMLRPGDFVPAGDGLGQRSRAPVALGDPQRR
jgi:hypothetical protein